MVSEVDVNYVKSIGLHKTLNKVVMRVLSERPATAQATNVVIQQALTEIDTTAMRKRGSVIARKNSVCSLEETDDKENEALQQRARTVEDALNSLRTHLMSMDVGIDAGVHDWLMRHAGMVPKRNESTVSESREVDAEADADNIVSCLGVLASALAEKVSKGQTTSSISLLVGNNGTPEFLSVAKECLDRKKELAAEGLIVSSISTLLRKTHDSYRDRVSEQLVLMSCQVVVASEDQIARNKKEFEICVTLIQLAHYTADATQPPRYLYEVIPSFGQVVEIETTEEHRHLCSTDAVVRLSNLPEAFYHFKLTVLNVVEHILHRVLHKEFKLNVRQRVGRGSIEEPLPVAEEKVPRDPDGE
ncbi:hypothetical protein DIPPA_30491 [Diplonema papillatum]|nr:hypothetical protein DIPPA_30491 [Diplonema papillatum]